MTKLKPCPFCGGDGVLNKYPVHGYEPAISFEVRCSSCNQRRVDGYFDTVYKSEKWARRKAIEAWNTRANSWHTGTPTEDGLYIIAIHPWGRKENGIAYICAKWSNGDWYDIIEDCYCEPYLVAWKKIEPYKEVSDGE